MSPLKLFLSLTLVFFAQFAKAQDICGQVHSGKADDFITIIAEKDQFSSDLLIQESFPDVTSSFNFWGQPIASRENYRKAVVLLSDKSVRLDATSIQKAHRALSNGKATLKFREASDAKIIGDFSFKGFSALSSAERKMVSDNPFLSFREAAEAKLLGTLDPDVRIGDIQYPNVNNYKKFADKLSPETIEKIKEEGPRKKTEVDDESPLNALIVKDLLDWSLSEAQKDIDLQRLPRPLVLTLLEWRVKSLGLYYEPIFVDKGKWLESDFSDLNLNRSDEVSEAIVDAFAKRNGLAQGKNFSLDRGIRPKMTDPLAEWIRYMNEAYDGTASPRIHKLVENLEKTETSLPKSQQAIFKDYYSTLILTGSLSGTATAQSVLKDFQAFRKINYNGDIPVEGRTTLIPMEYIRQFENPPEDLGKYLHDFYLSEGTLFRGVSNPWKITDGNVIEYFKSFKGRLASELARSNFDRRVELVRLSMLKFNLDLIQGNVTDAATQHAVKHLGYDSPNTAKTYFVSTTDLNTIAFRFAMDKGYISKSSANKDGMTHMVLESLQPKNGVVDFSEYKQTDPTWKNRFPRQRETAVAGGIDPYSIVRVYILEPYASSEKRPASGPEKHGKIAKLFERDEKEPYIINIKERDENGDFQLIDRVDTRK